MPPPPSRAAWLAAVLLLGALTGCLQGEDLDGARVDDPGPGASDAGEDSPVDGPPPWRWPSLDEALLRPGAKLFPQDVIAEPTGEGIGAETCTVNFVFTSSDRTSVYVGTASHCIDGMALGDELRIGGVVTGVLVYCSWGTSPANGTCNDKATAGVVASDDVDGFANDLALFRIEEGRQGVHPALLHWGGPTGLAQAAQGGQQVLTFGNSVARDGGTDQGTLDPREGYVREPGQWTTYVDLVAPTSPGDSGSPVLLGDGSALGVVQTVALTAAPGATGVVSLQAALDAVHAETDLQVELATWPLLQGPRLPPLPAPSASASIK